MLHFGVMVRARHFMKTRRPITVFLWQTLFIAVPVLVLSAIALYSLRLDKAAILEEARNQAQALVTRIAGESSRTISNALSALNLHTNLSGADSKDQVLYYGILDKGRILFPLDYDRLASPAEWPEKLTPEHSRLYSTFEEALYVRKDSAACRRVLSAMKTAGIPQDAVTAAEFNLLVLESGRDPAGAAIQLAELAQRHPEAITEAGTSIGDLSLITALQLIPAGRVPAQLVDQISDRAVRQPSMMTAELLQAAVERRANLSPQIRLLEPTRRLLRSLQAQLKEPPPNGGFWFEAEGKPFLALMSPVSSETKVIMVSGTWIEQTIDSELGAFEAQVPHYAALLLAIENHTWPVSSRGGQAPAPDLPADLLASASGHMQVRWEPDSPLDVMRRRVQSNMSSEALRGTTVFSGPFTIVLRLARPDLLYERQRERLWLMAGFILAAAAAAGIGLAGAWRTLQSQLRLSEMTSNFVSGVSHELRAPLASVRLMAESLDQGRIQEPEKQRSYFRLIVQECRRLSSLVENVLDFSRIREGRKTYEFEPVDLAALLRQTVQLMTPTAAEREVGLDLAGPGPGQNDLQPYCDGQAVQQALINLIDNAIKHSPPGRAVKIGCESGEKQFRMTVEDEGPGIPEEDRQRIFEPFYRRGSELRRETRGIGIGLSIVKHIAEAHGGRVFVESGSGNGSRFVFELPPVARGSDK